MLMHSRYFLPSVHAMFQVRCYISGLLRSGRLGVPEIESHVVTMTTSVRNVGKTEPGSASARNRAQMKWEKLAETAGVSR